MMMRTTDGGETWVWDTSNAFIVNQDILELDESGNITIEEEKHNSRIDKLILGEPITYSKPKVNGNYLYDCKLPYDDSTKDLIKQLRKSGHKIRVRGSGERAKWSLKDTNGRTVRRYDSHIPLKYASHVRLYITK